MTVEEIKTMLTRHKGWLTGNPDGNRADLRGANLLGADLRCADLLGADLRDADLLGADLPVLRVIRKIDQFRASVNTAATSGNCRINMSHWHTCDTVHCLAGWVVTVHPDGKLLESIYETPTAAALILIANGEAVPDFFDTSGGWDERAKNWLATGFQTDPQPVPES